MRDTIIALLLVLALIGWFSLYGPMIPVDERGLGPGEDRMGESPLVVAGPGAGIVDVAQGRPQGETGQAPSKGGATKTQDGAEAPREEHMDNITNLGWCVVGVVAVLTGAFTSPLVAWMWQKIRNK